MPKIQDIVAQHILDSRGNPTIEVTLVTQNGTWGVASVPSGASTGSHEAYELRDNDPQQYLGKGVQTAIDTIHTKIVPKLKNIPVTNQQKIDRTLISLDGTPNKAHLGANAILAVSLAAAKAAAKINNQPLFIYLHQLAQNPAPPKVPTILFNLINGGKHGQPQGPDFQEFFVIPKPFVPYPDALRQASEILHTLKKIFIDHHLYTGIGDEGGFTPPLPSNLHALEYLSIAIKKLQYTDKIDLGCDFAANSFYNANQKTYHLKDIKNPLPADKLISYYLYLREHYPLKIMEDPFAENDFASWQKLTAKIPRDTLIVGDDLTTTNPNLITQAASNQSITGVIIKPNQIGTLTETIQAIQTARQHGLKIIVSHRSGETIDTFIADLAVAVSADYAKFGAPQRGERVAKYNRLLAIYNYLTQES